MKTWKIYIFEFAMILCCMLFAASVTAGVVTPTVIIDDFEDGDVTDWMFFNGNLAGGGGGLFTDRPYEGSGYLGTGWGGEGTVSSFYGGFVKNLNNAAQIELPADPWFSVWVYNQSDTTVEEYTLEITLREDLDGNGWTDTQEDSFRLDASFVSSQFDDQWTRISAPVGSFINLSTGGNGIFDGELDEIVIVIGAVSGDSGSVVEVDFDYFAFTSGNPALPLVEFERAQFDVLEGSAATVTARLSAGSPTPVTVNYQTGDSSAVAGTDYVAVSDILTFPPNTLTRSFTVDTINDDLNNGNRTLNLALLDPSGARLGAYDHAELTIQDDEGACMHDFVMVDDFEDGELPYGTDVYGLDVGFFTFSGPGASVAKSIAQVSGDNALKIDSDIPDASWGGVIHHFENSSSDTWVTQDWSAYTTLGFSVYGTQSGKQLYFDIQDNRSSAATDNNEIFTYEFTDDFNGWRHFEVPFANFERKDVGNGAPDDGFGLTEINGWAIGSTGFTGTFYLDDVRVCGSVLPQPLAVGFDEAAYSVNEGQTATLTVRLNRESAESVAVNYATMESNARLERQYTAVSGTLTFGVGETLKTFEIPTFSDGKHAGDRRVVVNLYEDSVPLAFQRRTVLTIVDGDPADPLLVDDFEGYLPFTYSAGQVSLFSHTIKDSEGTATPYQLSYEDVLRADFDTTTTAASFDRVFSRGQDWSKNNGLGLWFYGSDSGQTITLQLRDNVSKTTGQVDSSEWVMVWSDEFNDPAGTPPNPNVWQHDLGDGALRGANGWGNSELQYYTANPGNVATDGAGNLVIRVDALDPVTTDLICWYGPCQYTSARLTTQDRIDFEYGRIEARIRVPTGPDGLWPAFWMLGADIAEVNWPQAGEIDVVEYVSRVPGEVFGTVHGPGYSGGSAFGGVYTFSEPVSNEYHTFTIEWGPDVIDWYVDGTHYHQAVPSDVLPNEWVFNHPFFMLLNTAIGGNFGGPVDAGMTFPQDTLVDYVRVYQAADTAERFEATFTDDFVGWREINLPFEVFSRSTNQPAGAPDDGLTLSEVWGYGFVMPRGTTGSFYLDRVSSLSGDVMFRNGFESGSGD